MSKTAVKGRFRHTKALMCSTCLVELYLIVLIDINCAVAAQALTTTADTLMTKCLVCLTRFCHRPSPPIRGDRESPPKQKIHYKNTPKRPRFNPQNMNTRNEALGALLSHHRKACGLSQQHLADKLLVSVRSVKAWEAGAKIPRQGRLEFLFQYLEFTLPDIISARRASMGLPRRRLPPPDLNPFGDSK